MNPNDTISREHASYICDFGFIHKDKKDLSRAYILNEDITFYLIFNRSVFLSDISITVYAESSRVPVLKADLEWYSCSCNQDEYRAKIKAKSLSVGLYYAMVEINHGGEVLRSKKEQGRLLFDSSASAPDIQISVSDFSHKMPEIFYGGIIYHIFVDRFSRGDAIKPNENAILIDDWSDGVAEYPEYPGAPMKNNTFYGGTIDGITKKLDYIESLGANVIYLSPVFDSPSNHKYDTADYMTVDPMFGGDKALKELIEECHRRNIYVILDGVFNHTGADSIYFNKYGNYDSVGAYQSVDSIFYDWYEFKSYPDDYKCWWDIEILPRIRTDSASAQNYFLKDGGVIDKYAQMGIDGIRLDVADELSDSFIERIKNALCKYNTSSILYGEVWEDASNKIAYDKRKRYYLGTELDGVMNYPLRKGLIDYFRNGKTEDLFYALDDIFKNAPKRITDAQMNILGTHDTIRILTALGAKGPEGLRNCELKRLRMTDSEKAIAKKRLVAAYTVLATLPGIPSIFYADEVGLEGYSDPFNRMPYPWGNEDVEILSFYRKVGEIRRKNDVYTTGGFSLLHLDAGIIAFERFDEHISLVTVCNNSAHPINITFTKGANDIFEDKNVLQTIINSGICKIFKVKKHSRLKLKK